MPPLDNIRCPLCHGIGFKEFSDKKVIHGNDKDGRYMTYEKREPRVRYDGSKETHKIECKHCGAEPTEDWVVYQQDSYKIEG